MYGKTYTVRKTSVPVDFYLNFDIKEVTLSFDLNSRTLVILVVMWGIRPMAEGGLMFYRTVGKRFNLGFDLLVRRTTSWIVLLINKQKRCNINPNGWYSTGHIYMKSNIRVLVKSGKLFSSIQKSFLSARMLHYNLEVPQYFNKSY